MAWQSRVKDMERSFETAESTILAARRRGKRGKDKDATATMTRAGATMTRESWVGGTWSHAWGTAVASAVAPLLCCYLLFVTCS